MAICPYRRSIPLQGRFKLQSFRDSVHTDEPRPEIMVDCGKCIVCKRNKALEWSIRLQHELGYHSKSCFITLTYEDDYLPFDYNYMLPNLLIDDLKKFWKRFRKRCSDPIKYFACGEYGSETLRPHYHAILFGWQPDMDGTDFYKPTVGTGSSRFLEDVWQQGMVEVGAVEPGSIHYVTGYMLKDGDNRYADDVGLSRTFRVMSNGLGKQFALDHKDEIRKGELKYNGKYCTIPRYYLEVLGLAKDREFRSMMRQRSFMYDEKIADELSKHSGVRKSDLELNHIIKGNRLAAERDLKRKLGLDIV